MTVSLRTLSVTLVLAILCLLVVLMLFGDVTLNGDMWFDALFRWRSLPAEIIWGIRLPRNLAGIGVGAMLGMSGALMQGLLRNPLAEPGLLRDAARQLHMVHILAMASGSRGMAGGQAIDLASVGLDLTQTELEQMHIHKTGALIRAAALLGAESADTVDADRIKAVDHYAQAIGLAFQVVDDILDSEADTTTLGKTAGKDADSNKPTYVTILGLERAKQLAQELYDEALAPLAAYGDSALRLQQLAKFITQRSF